MLHYNPILNINLEADEVKKGTPNPGADIELYQDGKRTGQVWYSNDWVHYSTEATMGSIDITINPNGQAEFAFYLSSIFDLPKNPQLKASAPSWKWNEPSWKPLLEGTSGGVEFNAHYKAANKAHNDLKEKNVLKEYPLPKDSLDKLVHSINSSL